MVCHSFVANELKICDQMFAYVGPGWLGQGKRDLVKIGERFGLVEHRRFGVPVVLPDSDHDDVKQHRIEDTDHGEFETGHLVVKAEAVGAPPPVGKAAPVRCCKPRRRRQ